MVENDPMKTKRRALRDSFMHMWPLVLAVPLSALACSSSSASKSQPGNDGGAPGDDGGLADGAAGDGGHGDLDAGIDPSLNPDPKDLDPTNGDPSLDIGGSQIYFDKGAPWVRVEFYGAWPPAATVYSWACSVILGTQNAPVVTYTVQSTKGKQTDAVDGMDKAKVTLAVEPRGFRVLLGDATLVFDRYALECNVESTDTGTMVQDTSGSFVITTKIDRAFGP